MTFFKETYSTHLERSGRKQIKFYVPVWTRVPIQKYLWIQLQSDLSVKEVLVFVFSPCRDITSPTSFSLTWWREVSRDDRVCRTGTVEVLKFWSSRPIWQFYPLDSQYLPLIMCPECVKWAYFLVDPYFCLLLSNTRHRLTMYSSILAPITMFFFSFLVSSVLELSAIAYSTMGCHLCCTLPTISSISVSTIHCHVATRVSLVTVDLVS